MHTVKRVGSLHFIIAVKDDDDDHPGSSKLLTILTTLAALTAVYMPQCKD